MSKNNNGNVDNKKSNGVTLKAWQLVLIVVIIILLVTGGVILGVNWNKWFGKKDIAATSAVTSSVNGADIDSGAEDWNGSSLADRTDESGNAVKGIQIPGYPSINLPANKTDVQVALLNPKGNPCYFTFAIVLNDTNETIYTSKQVLPGKVVTNLKLTRGLKAGTYKATIKITTNSLTDMSAMNGANVQTELVVK